MVHRDIKPSNILLTEDRKVKILDLGLGVLMEADSNATFATADGIAVGTVDYMSPEQALGQGGGRPQRRLQPGLRDVPSDDRASSPFPASRRSTGWDADQLQARADHGPYSRDSAEPRCACSTR